MYIKFEINIRKKIGNNTFFFRILVSLTVKVIFAYSPSVILLLLATLLGNILKILLLFILWYFAWSIIVIWMGVLTPIHWE